MKYFVLIVSLLSIAPSFASKSYNFKMEIRDIYTDEPLSDCPVLIDDGGIKTQVISDENGLVFFENIKKSEIQVLVITKNGNYEESDFKTTLNKKNGTFISYLYPSENYKNSLTLMEDKLYGKRDESSPGDKSKVICDDTSYNKKANEAAQEIQNFINSNVNYPEYSIENEEQGKVLIKFIIETDGSITHISIDKGVSMHLDREAIRLIRSLSNWSAAECNGKKIRTRVTLPIAFTLFY
jgi:TonB family protein